MRSEFVGLDTVMGRDESIGFEDFLSDPHTNPEIPKPVHAMMEEKLGMM